MSVNDLVWRVGGWLLKDGRVVPSISDEDAAFRNGAIRFTPMKGYMDVAYWSLHGTGTEKRINDFIRVNPPPENLKIEFHGVEPAGETMNRVLGHRAKLFKKGVTKMQYGTPTAINPILPSPSPEQEQFDEIEENKGEPVTSSAFDEKMPAQPGNPAGNQAKNGPQALKQPEFMEKEADRTILPEQKQVNPNTPYAYSQPKTRPIAETPNLPQSKSYAPAWVTGSRRAKLLDKKAAAPSAYTVENLRRLLENCDLEQPVIVVSAARQDIELPIYETWIHGRAPMISVDTDPFLAYLEKIGYKFSMRGSAKRADKFDYDLSEGSPTARSIEEERRARKRANAELAALGRRYHKTMPLQEIREILRDNGFRPEAMDGIYTGNDGKMHEQCGPRSWISMQWHRLENSRLWEITAYIS